MATWSGQVGFSADDAEQESTGNVVTVTNSLTELSEKGVNWVAFRFRNVLIPKKAKIEKVELEFFATSAQTGYTCFFRATTEANPAIFEATSNNISNRENIGGKGGGGYEFNTTASAYNTITSNSGVTGGVAEELEIAMAKSEWSEGNSILLALKSSSGKTLKIAMWDKAPTGEKSAKVKITYTSTVEHKVSVSATQEQIALIPKRVQSTNHLVTQNQTISSLKQPGLKKELAQGEILSFLKEMNLKKSLTQGQIISVPKLVQPQPHALTQESISHSVTQGQFPVPISVSQNSQLGPSAISKKITNTQGQTPVVQKTLSKTISNILQGSSSSLKRQAQRIVGTTQEAISIIAKKDLSLHPALTQIVTPVPLKEVKLKAINLSQGISVIVNTPLGVVPVTIAVTQSAVVEFYKFTLKGLRVIQPLESRVKMFLPKAFSIAQTQIIETKKTVEPQPYVNTQPQIVTMSDRYLRLYHFAVEVAQTLIPSVQKNIQTKLEEIQQSTEVELGRGFKINLSNIVSQTLELAKRFIRFVFISQPITLKETEPKILRHPSSGTITWTLFDDPLGDDDRLIKVESNLGQYEGEVEPGEPDVIYFTLNKKPEEVEGKSGTTTDPQWQ